MHAGDTSQNIDLKKKMEQHIDWERRKGKCKQKQRDISPHKEAGCLTEIGIKTARIKVKRYLKWNRGNLIQQPYFEHVKWAQQQRIKFCVKIE